MRRISEIAVRQTRQQSPDRKVRAKDRLLRKAGVFGEISSWALFLYSSVTWTVDCLVD